MAERSALNDVAQQASHDFPERVLGSSSVRKIRFGRASLPI